MFNNKGNNRNIKKIILAIIPVALFLIFTVFMSYSYNDEESKKTITYDQVIENISNGNIIKVNVDNNSCVIKVFFKDGKENKAVIPNLEEFTSLVTDSIKQGHQIEFNINNSMNSLSVSNIISIFFVVFCIRLLNKQFNGSDYSVTTTSSTVVFDDVAGIDEEKEQLVEVVKFLQNPDKYINAGARIPRGILLTGDPGVGKTLLAKAIAGEADVPFFQVNGSSFEEKFVGVGASRIRKLFNKAKQSAPCIIFIDELDSLAKSRYGTKTSYSEQSLNQLLAEMDGFDSSDNIIVIAATNHPEVLDSAITRPGRFDRKISIPRPDLNARERILKVHSKNKSLAKDVSLREIAKKTVGFSGADLENLLNEAAIYAVNHDRTDISKEDITESIEKVLVGLKKKNIAISEDDLYRTAVHEAGHALASMLLRPNVDIIGISITPRGNAGGYNFFNESDKLYTTKNSFLNELQVLYAGRIAEELILGSISNGSSNDLEKASQLAYDMVYTYGMGDSLLVKLFNHDNHNQILENSKMTQLEEICSTSYANAERLLKSYISILQELSSLLFNQEYLTQEDVKRFIEEHSDFLV